ncbi:MAG TPA: hypothetical protein VD735_07275 [Candidatus Saccharimonadales bacterium]|nr:hypothetical protein [Candidatus Saccharimonadales bacterium]
MSRRLLALYRLVLRLYPRGFRQQYGEPMFQTLTDMLDDQPSTTARAGVWLRVLFDLQSTVIRQQLQHTGETIMRTTNKVLIAGVCLTVAVIGVLLLPVLRSIGTTWTDFAGFARVLGLLAFLITAIIVPICLAVVALCVPQSTLAKRFAKR